MSALRPRLSRLVGSVSARPRCCSVFALALRAAGSTLWPLDRRVLAVGGALRRRAARRLHGRGFADRFEQTADLHFALDTLLIAASSSSPAGSAVFTPLFALPVVAAAGVQYRCGSLRIATFASACLLAIVIAQVHRCRHAAGRPPLPPADVAWITVGLNVFAFFAVAFLAGQLAENLRRADVMVEAASEKIADLEAFNRNVIDHLASGLLTMDAAGRVLTSNRAAAAITGWPGRSRAARRRRPCSCPPSSPPIWPRPAPRPGPPRRLHLPPARRPAIELGVSAAPLPLGGRRARLHLHLPGRDRHQGLERTAQMRQRLAAVGEMAAGIAHEIRNPLASMSGAMQVLRGELPLSAEQAQLMDIVLRESDRLNATISSFLAYARPGPGRCGAHRCPAARAGRRRTAATSPETLAHHAST